MKTAHEWAMRYCGNDVLEGSLLEMEFAQCMAEARNAALDEAGAFVDFHAHGHQDVANGIRSLKGKR